jgi:hypothetical protein
VLGVSRGASAEQVREAYLAAARREHPDCRGGDPARFLRAKEAYEAIASGAARSNVSPRRSTTAAAAAAAAAARARPSAGFGAADFHAEQRKRRSAPGTGRPFATPPTAGLGLGVLCVSLAACVAFTVVDLAWRGANGGTSLREVQEAAGRARVETEARRRARQPQLGKRRRRRKDAAAGTGPAQVGEDEPAGEVTAAGAGGGGRGRAGR